MNNNTLEINDFPLDIENESEEKSKLYLKVYDAILDGIEKIPNILEGVKLPTEDDFAKYWNVSRGTIREAMYHLLEDGVISKVQGRRTVVSMENKLRDFEFQNLGNPVKQSVKFDNIVIKKQLSSTSNWLAEKLSLSPGVPVIRCIADYYYEEERVATSFFLLPFSLIEKEGIPWEDDECWNKFICETLYEKTVKAEASICIVRDKIEDRELQYIDSPVLLIEEFLFDKDKSFAFARTYLNDQSVRIKVLRK